MKCKFCNKEIDSIYKIRIYKEMWNHGMVEEMLINTSFICKDCLNKNKFEFNE